uniref:ZP domain-containing protein n=1 Tax=Parascaris univalens TaxID=6257 RepID=A0A915BFL1_PARUN
MANIGTSNMGDPCVILFATTKRLCVQLALCEAKTIDNRLKDTPSVACGPEKISIEGRTEEPFEGVVFIKNFRRTDGCAAKYELDQNSTTPRYSIALDRIAQCGLELRRSPESKELEIFTVFVFSFHPNFVTAGDRSFAVHCIFLQQQVTVATKFNFISDITTRGIIGGTAAIPIIDLTIVPGRVPDPTLEPAHTVIVGEPLMYIWHLKSETEIYGLRVKDCFAEAKDGRKMKIINDGCSVDPLIVSNVQYSENSHKAFADGMAFKFPDAEDVWVICAVTTCIRRFEHLLAHNEENLCDSQPKCTQREKRSTEMSETSAVSVYSIEDLVNHRLHVIESPAHALPLRQANVSNGIEQMTTDDMSFCLEKGSFAGALAALISAYLIAVCFASGIGFAFYRSNHKKY